MEMDDDLERLNQLLDDLAAERHPRDRAAFSAEDAALAQTAAFLKAAVPERGRPGEAFVARLGAQLAGARNGWCAGSRDAPGWDRDL